MASLTSTVSEERFLTAFEDDQALDTTCQEIALEIQSGHTKLYAIIEELRPFVTEKDVTIRKNGISALSTILFHLPKDFLNEDELCFITSFYCDRLKDHHRIIPAVIKGVLTIVQMDHLPKDSPECLLRSLFENVQCQSQLSLDRRNIYFIFTTLLENRIEDLKAMGPDFIYGFITSIETERDPSNLMILFDVLPYFMKKLSLGHLAGEMFEVIACYFPVDFHPRRTEGITRDDLAEKLAPCLCAVPEFAEFCIPLIIEKLLSNLKIAKLDSLSLLCKSIKTFGVNGIKIYLTELWIILRKEIIPGGDLELKNASLKAVTTIIDTISSDVEVRESFINDITTDLDSSLYDVQLSLFRPSVKILECVAMINKESCIQVLKAIVPIFLGQYSTKTAIVDKVILIETLNNFIKTASDHGFTIKDVPELAWTDIPNLYLNELSTENMELQSKILFGLTIQKAYLNEVHRTLLYDKICNLIGTNCNEIKILCHSALLSFATLYSNEISTLIKEKFQLNTDEEKIEIRIRKLKVLATVAKTYKLGVEVLPQIVLQTNVANFDISFTALTCLHRLVATTAIDYNILQYLYNECHIIQKLAALNINPMDERLDLVLNICRLIVRNLMIEEQQNLVNKYISVLSKQSSESDAALVMNIFIPLYQDVDLAINVNLLQNVHNLALYSQHPNIRLIACKFIAVILNKFDDSNKYFQHALSYFKEAINNNLNSDTNIEIMQASASLQIWLTKAIIIKGSRDVEIFLDELTNILKHDRIGQHMVQEYKILTNRHEDTLVVENFCNVKILYKQRVFEHLIKKDSEFKNIARQNYLKTLVQLLEEVPLQLLLMYLIKLVPLLIESLSLENEQLIFLTLTTLNLLLETKHSIFSDMIQSFIPRLLKLSTYRIMRVRIAALDCLTNYCNYPTIFINTYKQDVLEKLIVPIDDRKRLVRKAAVKARSRWFLVGAPGAVKRQ
ncbi:MMS19 nucleotide excision repair protein isoform X1 [Bombus huntii]|uniref:MMS19 nucleotide excision repair protein isoform X1 n=2 Tax=Bombus huntii TaxID=85661 RepID=UPI0021AA2FE2|nr:MMS19 nucleotide excision repair protein isoform X1 [Bombus huntii]